MQNLLLQWLKQLTALGDACSASAQGCHADLVGTNANGGTWNSLRLLDLCVLTARAVGALQQQHSNGSSRWQPRRTTVTTKCQLIYACVRSSSRDSSNDAHDGFGTCSVTDNMKALEWHDAMVCPLHITQDVACLHNPSMPPAHTCPRTS